MIEQAPGTYTDVSQETYDDWDAFRSTVAGAMDRSASHGFHAAQNGITETDDMLLGKAVHVSALEPSIYADRFTRRPLTPGGAEIKLSTTAGIAFADDASKRGLRILSKTAWNKCEGMTAGIVRQPWYSEAVESAPGVFELSLVWDDPHSGLRCKARIDRLTGLFQHHTWDRPYQTIFELKTAHDASERGFQNAIREYKLDVQAAMQLEAIKHHDPATPTKFLWLVVEKKDPFEARLWEPSAAMLARGLVRFRSAATAWKECTAAGDWPGYEQRDCTLEIPSWDHDAIEDTAPEGA